MKTEHRHTSSILFAIFVLAYLSFQTVRNPLTLDQIPVGFLFLFLIVFTTTFGVPISGGIVSLLPMSVIAAFLVLDTVPAGWITFAGAYINEGVRVLFRKQLGIQRRHTLLGLFAVGSANAAIQTTSILVGAWAYKSTGGEVPFSSVTIQNIISLAVIVGVYFSTNLSLIAIYMLAIGKRASQTYIKSLDRLLLFEGTPLIFLPLMPLIYSRLGFWLFLLYSLALVIASLISRNLALTSRGLVRRVQELDSLQIVGQTLSASLQLDSILPAIYEQMALIMPVDNFYVALYHSEADEVTFPFAVEKSQRVTWQPRKAGNGLTEHVLHSRKPLLISSNVGEKLNELNIEQHGKLAFSWLGVPILGKEGSIGVIAVQSYVEADRYDESHKDVLVTIAAQASIAIQNARLYEQTDEALARRVQELNSILRTSKDGMLLLSLDWRILAANKALADFFQLPQTEFSGDNWGSVQLDESPSLLRTLGFSLDGLQRECQILLSGDFVERKFDFSIPGQQTRFLERTLAPVYDHENRVIGWLIVYREVTEEKELAKLREDMTHMLVHDLRSPLAALQGSLWVIRRKLNLLPEDDNTLRMISIAERNSQSMIKMVESLLDIARLEDGDMPLITEVVALPQLFEDILSRVSQLYTDANVHVESVVDPGLPKLEVDRDHIQRVLLNLLDNAIKFTPDGGRICLWAQMDGEDDTPWVLIGVKDTGPGISKSTQKKLFQKFHTDSSIRGRRRGTGLGLAYCKLAVEAHGGVMWVESHEGQGSTFLMRLPAVVE